MIRIYTLFLLLFIGASALAQSTTLIEAQALRQINDLKGGKLLIPLNSAQRSVAQGAQSMDWAIAKEENESLRRSFQEHFTMCQVLFFYTDENGNVDEVFDHRMTPVKSPYYDESVFIAHLHTGEFQKKPDHIEYSKKADKRRARQRKNQSRQSEKKSDWQEKQLARVDANIAENRDRWTHEQFERALAIRKYYENYFEPTVFETELMFWSPDKMDAGCMVIERTSPVLIQKNKKKSYSFNFQFYARDYPELDINQRFVRLAQTLHTDILNTEEELLKKASREAKLYR